MREDDLRIPAGLDGRVVRHVVGDVRPRPHRHVELELNLVVRGTSSYLLGERRYELTPGTLTWLFRGQGHVLVDESADHELWWAVFRPGLVARTATTSERPLLEADPVGRFSRRLGRESARRLATLCEEVRSAESSAVGLANAGLAYLLLLAWRMFIESSDVVEGAYLHPAVEAVARLLTTDPNAGDLPRLAAAAALSPSHLSRLFKAQTGVSITRFRNQQRLERFLALYGRGHTTTALSAALDAGFGSYAQFYRVFREHTGRTPATLRASSY